MTTSLAPRKSVRALIRSFLTRTPRWSAPHRWADAGGLYATDTDAWLYRELPLSVLRADANGVVPLDTLLGQLAALGTGRDVHLLVHAWEEQALPPEGTPDELADYLTGALTFFVPTRRLLLGARLYKSEAALAVESKVVPSSLATLDRLLGEHVPDLSAWDDDRHAVEAVLNLVGASAPSPAASAHLESWYTLGAGVDVDVDERDDVISFNDSNVAELCSVASLDLRTGGDAHALMSAGRRGATVVSVRGQLAGAGSRGREATAGTLSKVSVVLGRRSERMATPWSVALRKFPGLEQRPLPMRQLQALDETLPCSKTRVSPGLSRIRTAHLSRVGFADTVRVGDDDGIFLGLASPDYSYPFYLNPAAPAAPATLVTGAQGAGKTFVAENAAVQAALAGQRVIYVTTGAGAGAAVRELAGAIELSVNESGAFDPFRYLPAAVAAPVAETAVAALVPDLTATERSDLAAGFRRAAAVGDGGFDRVFAFADGVTAVAKVRRTLQRSPFLAAAVSGGPVVPAALPGVALVDLSWFLPLRDELGDGEDASLVAAVVDLACAVLVGHAVAAPAPGGTLVVLDGAGAVLDGPLTHAALTDAAAAPGAVHVLVTTAHTVRAAASDLTRHAGRILALAEDDPAHADAALDLVGLPRDARRREWLVAARAEVGDGVVRRPALGVHRDARGRSASVLLGPVPPRALSALTRAAADQYVAAS